MEAWLGEAHTAFKFRSSPAILRPQILALWPKTRFLPSHSHISKIKHYYEWRRERESATPVVTYSASVGLSIKHRLAWCLQANGEGRCRWEEICEPPAGMTIPTWYWQGWISAIRRESLTRAYSARESILTARNSGWKTSMAWWNSTLRSWAHFMMVNNTSGCIHLKTGSWTQLTPQNPRMRLVKCRRKQFHWPTKVHRTHMQIEPS